ncbi:MAG: hypothetical protein IJW43_01975 [Clostridia bacterium]|nr:hypothetical protein [Clostridia bacterium]
MKSVRIKKIDLPLFEKKVNLFDGESKKSVLSASKISPVNFNGCIPKRLYSLFDRTYCYAEDGTIYQMVENEFFQIMEKSFSSEPNILSMRNRAEETLLICDNEKGYFLNDEENSLKATYSKVYCHAFGKIISAKGRKLIVEHSFNLVSDQYEFKKEFCFTTEADEGDIVGICQYGEDILLVCKHKIITLNLVKNAFGAQVERVNTPHINALENSFNLCGENAIFISGNEIAVYNNGNLSFYPFSSKVNELSIFGDCKEIDGKFYLIPFTVDGEKSMLCFSLDTRTFFEMKGEFSALSKNGGLFYKDDNLYKISQVATSGKLDFDYLGAKTLYKIEIKCEGRARLIIDGDFSKKQFDLKAGLNQICCNLTSSEFGFSFDNASSDFCILESKVTYTKI